MPSEGESQSPRKPATRFRIACGGVLLDESRLAELDSGRVMVEVEHAEIRKITLAFGLISHHPFLQAFFGLGLAATAIFPIGNIVLWLKGVEKPHRAVLFILPVSVIGAATFFGAFRDGHFLEIESTRGLKRLAFKRKTDPAAIEQFVQQIERRLGISIEREPEAVAKTINR
jgi:hypothetical protein